MPIPLCCHLKQDGMSCGSPALRGKKLCYFHQRDHQRLKYTERILRCNDPLRPTAPLPKTLPEMQFRLYDVMTALADDSLPIRRASKLLCALQQRSASLRKLVS